MAWQLTPTAQQASSASTASSTGRPMRHWQSALLMSATCTGIVMQSTCLSSCCSRCCPGQSRSYYKGGRKLLCVQSLTLDWKQLVRAHGHLYRYRATCQCLHSSRLCCASLQEMPSMHMRSSVISTYMSYRGASSCRISSTEDRMHEAL